MKKIAAIFLTGILIVLQISTVSEKAFGQEVINSNKLSLIVKQVLDLKLSVKGKINNVVWKSMNDNIAQVNQTGKVQAMQVGKTDITCSYKIKNKNCIYKWTVSVKNVPAMFRNKLMAHALGGLENKYIYCNALEGLEQSTQNGYKFMETDLILTSDDKLVCSHGWSKESYGYTGVPYDATNPVMSYDQFMKTKIDGKYTTIDINNIVQYMKEHKDVYFEFDLRTIDKETTIKTTEKIVQAFNSDKELLDRILIQAGSNEMYEGIKSVYPFKYCQRFVHNNELKNIASIIEWCKANNITSIAVYKEHLTPKIIKTAKENGICVLTHTVDDVSEAENLLNEGVNAICTNFITNSQLEGNN